jgi:hypothetical protein
MGQVISQWRDAWRRRKRRRRRRRSDVLRGKQRENLSRCAEKRNLHAHFAGDYVIVPGVIGHKTGDSA